MVKVSFTIDGSDVVVDGQTDETVMQVAVRNEIPRIDGECGGELSCATCHVWMTGSQGFRPRSQEEEELLELADDVTDSSRLSCQLKLRNDMTEVQVTVP